MRARLLRVDESILDSALSLFGPGRAARAFARSWTRAGGRVNEVIARDADRAAQAAREIGAGRPRASDSGPIACDLLVLGVPDDAIHSLARRLAGRVSCRVAFHLSGALAAKELAPIAAAATAVGSLHPVRAFSGAPDETWEGAFVAIEGEREAARVGELVVAAIGAQGHRIEAAAKPLYHAAATLAAGGSIALLSLAVRAWASLGIPEHDSRAALCDLSARAAGAAVSRDFEDVFTGPVARRDVGTVRSHRSALARFPEALAVYDVLARETLARTSGHGKEDEILAVLEER